MAVLQDNLSSLTKQTHRKGKENIQSNKNQAWQDSNQQSPYTQPKLLVNDNHKQFTLSAINPACNRWFRYKGDICTL